jgi:hypothetical protein
MDELCYYFNVRFTRGGSTTWKEIQVLVERGRRLLPRLIEAIIDEGYDLKHETNPDGWEINRIRYDFQKDDGSGRLGSDGGRGTKAIEALKGLYPMAFPSSK